MKMTKRRFAGALGLALTLSACGGSDGLSEADAELAGSLATEWSEGGEFPESVDEQCLAEGFVEGVGGADGAAEVGLTTANIGDADFEAQPLSEESARAVSANMFACDGFETALLSEMGPEVTDEQASCLAEQVDDSSLESLIASTFMGEAGAAIEAELENTFEEDFFTAFGECDIEL